MELQEEEMMAQGQILNKVMEMEIGFWEDFDKRKKVDSEEVGE